MQQNKIKKKKKQLKTTYICLMINGKKRKGSENDDNCILHFLISIKNL